MERVSRQWQSDIPSLTEDAWTDIVLVYSQLSTIISARDRDKLIKFKHYHRMYYTPSHVFKIGRIDSLDCPRCHYGHADFFSNGFGHVPELGLGKWVSPNREVNHLQTLAKN